MSKVHPWDQLCKRTKEVYGVLGSHNEKEIAKISSKDIRKADRESRLSGYSEANQSAYRILQFEQEHRAVKRNWYLAICGVVVAVLGVIVAVFVK